MPMADPEVHVTNLDPVKHSKTRRNIWTKGSSPLRSTTNQISLCSCSDGTVLNQAKTRLCLVRVCVGGGQDKELPEFLSHWNTLFTSLDPLSNTGSESCSNPPSPSPSSLCPASVVTMVTDHVRSQPSPLIPTSSSDSSPSVSAVLLYWTGSRLWINLPLRLSPLSWFKNKERKNHAHCFRDKVSVTRGSRRSRWHEALTSVSQCSETFFFFSVVSQKSKISFFFFFFKHITT